MADTRLKLISGHRIAPYPDLCMLTGILRQRAKSITTLPDLSIEAHGNDGGNSMVLHGDAKKMACRFHSPLVVGNHHDLG